LGKFGNIGREGFLLKERVFRWNPIDEGFGATGNVKSVFDFRVGYKFIIPKSRSIPRPIPEQGGN
jgi:hypothetical protein